MPPYKRNDIIELMRVLAAGDERLGKKVGGITKDNGGEPISTIKAPHVDIIVIDIAEKQHTFEVADVMYRSDSCVEVVALSFMSGTNADGSPRAAKKSPKVGFVRLQDYRKMARGEWHRSMLCQFSVKVLPPSPPNYDKPGHNYMDRRMHFLHPPAHAPAAKRAMSGFLSSSPETPWPVPCRIVPTYSRQAAQKLSDQTSSSAPHAFPTSERAPSRPSTPAVEPTNVDNADTARIAPSGGSDGQLDRTGDGNQEGTGQGNGGERQGGSGNRQDTGANSIIDELAPRASANGNSNGSLGATKRSRADGSDSFDSSSAAGLDQERGLPLKRSRFSVQLRISPEPSADTAEPAQSLSSPIAETDHSNYTDIALHDSRSDDLAFASNFSTIDVVYTLDLGRVRHMVECGRVCKQDMEAIRSWMSAFNCGIAMHKEIVGSVKPLLRLGLPVTTRKKALIILVPALTRG